MYLYVIRHGQTDWNVQKKVQGLANIELNETGINQAENARGLLEKENIDLIICSPLKRTIQSEVETLVSKAIIAKEIDSGDNIEVYLDGEELKLRKLN